jgi:hypothetical protein
MDKLLVHPGHKEARVTPSLLRFNRFDLFTAIPHLESMQRHKFWWIVCRWRERPESCQLENVMAKNGQSSERIASLNRPDPIGVEQVPWIPKGLQELVMEKLDAPDKNGDSSSNVAKSRCA